MNVYYNLQQLMRVFFLHQKTYARKTQLFLTYTVGCSKKKRNYINLLSFAHFFHKKLKTRDIFRHIGWIVSESQRNFLWSTCLL